MKNDLTRIARRTTLTLFLAQSLASEGFIAAATLNAILGAKSRPCCLRMARRFWMFP